MDQKGFQVPSFEPEEYTRDAALAAAGDPFLNALGKTRDRVPQLTEAFATQDTPSADTDTRITAWPDPAPMSSRDLYEV